MNGFFHLYADDTIFIQSHLNKNALVESLENQMVALYDWLTLNKLTLNMTKTETIFFGNSRKTNQCTNLKVKLNGKEIQNKPFVKYLGVYLDRNLTWKKHIDVIKGKAYNKYSQIKGLYNILTAETRTLLCNDTTLH